MIESINSRTLSNRQAKSIWMQSPVEVSRRIFSPCLSPNPSMCPTMHQTAEVRVNANRAFNQLAGSVKLERKKLCKSGGYIFKTLLNKSAILFPYIQITIRINFPFPETMLILKGAFMINQNTEDVLRLEWCLPSKLCYGKQVNWIKVDARSIRYCISLKGIIIHLGGSNEMFMKPSPILGHKFKASSHKIEVWILMRNLTLKPTPKHRR